MSSHVYQSSHVARISIAKINSKTVLNNAQNHNSREKERLGKSTGTHIDDRRVKFNDTIVQSNHSIWQEVVSRVTGTTIIDAEDIARVSKNDLRYADGAKVKSDAVLAFETEMGYPGDLMWHKFNEKGEPVPVDISDNVNEEAIRSIEQGGKGYFLWPADKKEFEEWNTRNIAFLQSNFGAENVVSIEVHMDESKPHMHALILPAYEDEKGITRFSCRRMLNEQTGFSNYRVLQTTYANEFSDMGYVRGEEYSNLKAYSDREEMREIASKVIHAKLPKDRSEAEIAYKTLLAKNAELEREVQNRRNQPKQIAKLIKEKKELEEKLAQKEEEFKQINAIKMRRECELLGSKLQSDQEMIKNIYFPLQEKMISDGIAELKERFNVEVENNKDLADDFKH